MSEVKWLNYSFEVYLKDGEWNEVPGVYIFCGTNEQNEWEPYYVGKAKKFSARLPNHEQWAAAVRLGATHVHALVVPLEANRDKIEAELIAAYKPPLNVQLK
ncbi:MAG TPA: hypothetical protein VNZ64_03765 [Candidatus Acidoferrum sp.]|jgi:excinuclease UvrABC nuclease subunit|nr:hypothetical protein [Candidatus Acidoferrum sp.]